MKSYTLKGEVTVTVKDKTVTTPNTLEMKYYGSVPNLPEVVLNAPLRQILDRGNHSHYEEDTDQINVGETVEFTFDMVDDQVTSDKHAWYEWFYRHKTVAGTALTTTNDGSAKALDLSTGTTVTINVPSGIFTCILEIACDAGDGKKVTRTYTYFRPIACEFSGEQDMRVTVRGELLGCSDEAAAT